MFGVVFFSLPSSAFLFVFPKANSFPTNYWRGTSPLGRGKLSKISEKLGRRTLPKRWQIEMKTLGGTFNIPKKNRLSRLFPAFFRRQSSWTAPRASELLSGSSIWKGAAGVGWGKLAHHTKMSLLVTHARWCGKRFFPRFRGGWAFFLKKKDWLD